MKVSEIINQVRWSLDEEKNYEDYETTYMDNIIKAKVYDALRWVCLYADATLLGTGTASTSGGAIYHNDNVEVGTDGKIQLDGNFLQLIRVRVSGWSKAVMSTIKEDSDEYIMQYDPNYPESKADSTRPVVAMIESVPPYLEVFPHPTTKTTASLTYSMSISDSTTTIDEDTEISIPTKVQSAYIYYLCYLVMIAYNDTTKAANMLAVARMNAGISDTKTS